MENESEAAAPLHGAVEKERELGEEVEAAPPDRKWRQAFFFAAYCMLCAFDAFAVWQWTRGRDTIRYALWAWIIFYIFEASIPCCGGCLERIPKCLFNCCFQCKDKCRCCCDTTECDSLGRERCQAFSECCTGWLSCCEGQLAAAWGQQEMQLHHSVAVGTLLIVILERPYMFCHPSEFQPFWVLGILGIWMLVNFNEALFILIDILDFSQHDSVLSIVRRIYLLLFIILLAVMAVLLDWHLILNIAVLLDWHWILDIHNYIFSHWNWNLGTHDFFVGKYIKACMACDGWICGVDANKAGACDGWFCVARLVLIMLLTNCVAWQYYPRVWKRCVLALKWRNRAEGTVGLGRFPLSA